MALGIAIAATCFEIGIDLGGTDKAGILMGFGLVSGVFGAMLGAFLYVWTARGRLAAARIRRAQQQYDLDLRKLEELAQSYEPRIAQAVKTVRDEALLG